jgi:hypothetical protein
MTYRFQSFFKTVSRNPTERERVDMTTEGIYTENAFIITSFY